MRRRDFIAGLTGAVLWPVCQLRAQLAEQSAARSASLLPATPPTGRRLSPDASGLRRGCANSAGFRWLKHHHRISLC